MAFIGAALMAPFAKTAPAQEFYAKVGHDKLTLTVMPSVVSIGLEADSGLSEGDYVHFHIEHTATGGEVVWKGRHIKVRNVELTP